jgi:hypothetical protein
VDETLIVATLFDSDAVVAPSANQILDNPNDRLGVGGGVMTKVMVCVIPGAAVGVAIISKV